MDKEDLFDEHSRLETYVIRPTWRKIYKYATRMAYRRENLIGLVWGIKYGIYEHNG